jgi:hypothetical protein
MGSELLYHSLTLLPRLADHPRNHGVPTMPTEHSSTNGNHSAPIVDKPVQSNLIADEASRARVDRWLQTVRELDEMTDETDTPELWDEFLRNLGVDPVASMEPLP